MADKRFYWIKLKTDFFNQDTIDFLLSQENGCEYIVLYQMLCLKTANNDGELVTNLGEMIVPYDIEKIVRDTKYFNTDTVIVALELFKKLGLIYQEENKILKISNFKDMVGSETSSAKKVREWREKKRLHCNQNVTNNVIQEIENRDKSIENRDKNKDNNIYDFVEKNFQRVLSPLEMEEIMQWEDNDLTRYAIKQAVLNGARSIKYINTILSTYKAKGVLSVEEAIKENEKFKKSTKKNETIPEWFDKEVEVKEVSNDERKEMEDLLKKFR